MLRYILDCNKMRRKLRNWESKFNVGVWALVGGLDFGSVEFIFLSPALPSEWRWRWRWRPPSLPTPPKNAGWLQASAIRKKTVNSFSISIELLTSLRGRSALIGFISFQFYLSNCNCVELNSWLFMASKWNIKRFLVTFLMHANISLQKGRFWVKIDKKKTRWR